MLRACDEITTTTVKMFYLHYAPYEEHRVISYIIENYSLDFKILTAV